MELAGAMGSWAGVVAGAMGTCGELWLNPKPEEDFNAEGTVGSAGKEEVIRSYPDLAEKTSALKWLDLPLLALICLCLP